MKQSKLQFFASATILLTNFLILSPTQAQINPDTTLPQNSTITREGNTLRIENGTAAGSNLFHSFREFSVNTGETAYFNNSLNIENIFSRVTGSSLSNIDGLIRANNTANLFLINPNGILFGPNASLDIGGSFFASTAESLLFADGTEYSATNPESTPLLTINVPIGLQFGQRAAEINVQGSGHDLEIVDFDTLEISRNNPAGLEGKPGNTIALVGGNINLLGGNLIASGGRVELGSVGANSIVGINPAVNGFTLQYTGIENFQDIRLAETALVDVSGNNGQIQVQGRNIFLSDGSAIIAITTGAEQGGILTVRGSESVEFNGFRGDPDEDGFFSGLKSQTQGSGIGSDLVVEAQQLIVDGGEIFASTIAEGNGGDVTIRVTDLVELTGAFTNNGVSGLFAQANAGSGDGGNLTIETGRFIAQAGAYVSTTTYEDGNAGNFSLFASESVILRESSFLVTQTEPFSNGTGGDLTIISNRLNVESGSEISASTFGSGNAGNLRIRANEIIVTGVDDIFPSGIYAQVNYGYDEENDVIIPAAGNGGNLTIETQKLRLENGGRVQVSTFSEGNAGNLVIRGIDNNNGGVSEAELVEAFGIAISEEGEVIRSDDEPIRSGLFATTEDSGEGGNLTINTQRLIIRDGAQAAASTLGTGDGGSVTVNASELVDLSGGARALSGEIVRSSDPGNPPIQSGILARVRGEEASGNAGSVTINSPRFVTRDGAIATVSSAEGSGSSAGDLNINALEILLDQGTLSAETRSGDDGNITIRTADIRLRNNSRITTNATDLATGGNIGISTDTLVALENSDISANSDDSSGGKVGIDAQAIFRQGFLGTEFDRSSSDFRSDITATSELGPQLDGTVELQTPDIDPTQGLVGLPQDFAPSEIPTDFCAIAILESLELIDTGRGGLPPDPREALNSGIVTNQSGNSLTIPAQRIVEARGWIKTPNGEIVLVSQTPTNTAYGFSQQPKNCSI